MTLLSGSLRLQSMTLTAVYATTAPRESHPRLILRYSDGDWSRRHDDSATSSDSDSDFFDGDIDGRSYRQLKGMPEPRKVSDVVKKKPRRRAQRQRREGIKPGELGLA